MRVRRFVAGLTLFLLSWGGLRAAQEDEPAALLLLTPKLLRRLQRDRERQTVRWANFEKRVQIVPESPERGFELALYYAVTHDRSRGDEAIRWALDHKRLDHQVALILNWVADLISPEQQQRLKNFANPHVGTGPAPVPELVLRDQLFATIAKGTGFEAAQSDSQNKLLVSDLRKPSAIDPQALYASVEYLMAMRSFTHSDLREVDPHFFSMLPKKVLLSLRPEQADHPDWMVHIAALALVTLDPNLENSQFLQGWAMEDRQMLRDGPGVAYEFMWADPYLPGIAYQNMDPWIYDPSGLLFARSNWDPNACWIQIAGGRQETENCGSSIVAQPTAFGTLTLTPFTAPCAIIATRKNRDSMILWKIKPGTQLVYENGGRRDRQQADAAGLWPVPNDTSGKVCLESQSRR